MPDFPTFDHWFPPVVPPESPRRAPPYALRNPLEDEVVELDARLADWCEPPSRGRARPDLAPPLRGHLAGWPKPRPTARLIGVLLGFRSAGPARRGRRPGRGGRSGAPSPRHRAEPSSSGSPPRLPRRAATSLLTVPWRPDDRAGLAFLRDLGFAAEAGPGSSRIYGVPAYPDWDGPGEDRALMQRAIGG